MNTAPQSAPAESMWAILVKAEIRKLAKRGVKFSKSLLQWAGV
jgi:hypothetical protein